MTRSIMLRPGTLLDLFPCAARCRMREESLLAPPQFIALPIRDGQLRILLRDAVPEVFDQLQALCSRKLEERCEFGVHFPLVTGFQILFKRGRGRP